MANPAFKANVSFEKIEETRKWAVYKVVDKDRGHLGFFRINRETSYCDDRDGDGVLQLGAWFSGQMTTEEFADRFEMLNWVYDVFGEFMGREELPAYEFIST